MAIQKELWLPVIEENFFAEWSKLTQLGKDDSVYVIKNGAHVKVHIPNAGSPGAVVKNNTSYPVTVTERTDTTVEYNVDSFQVPPVRVGRYDAAMLSYDKLQSIAKDFMGGIGEHLLYNSFVNWYIGKQTGKFVETTGSTVPSEATGATGNVKAITTADVKKAAKILDKQKVPQTGRILLLPASMFYQLHDSVIEKFDIVDNDGLAMFDKEFYGFQVVKMPYVLQLQSNGTVREVGNAGATTDIEGGLAYHKDMVSIARENTYIYDGADRPEYYGDIMSAEAWAGAKYRRTDLFGVVPVLQTTV